MRTLEQWALIIEDMRASGMPQKQWCAQQGVSWQTLHAALTRLNKMRREQDGMCPKFVQVQSSSSIPTVTVTCRGVTLSTTAKDAAAILAHLAGVSPC